MNYKKIDRDTTLEILFNEDGKYIIEKYLGCDNWILTKDSGERILRNVQLYGVEYRYSRKVEIIDR